MALRSTTEQASPRAGRTNGIDAYLARQCGAELLGTAILVFAGAGVATVAFGFRGYGASVAAGIVAVALAFGLVFIGLFAMIGPISGCHVNPAVTLGAYLTKRIRPMDAVGYVLAQLAGGIIGALLLLWVFHSSPLYIKGRVGLGANGYGSLSLLHMSGGGAFLAEIILTAIFVLVVLSATSNDASRAVAGVAGGLTLGVAVLVAVPIDGASINPARSLGPALITGGLPLSQVWLFLVAPLVGGVLAGGIHLLLLNVSASPGRGPLAARHGTPAVTHSAADEELRPTAEGAAAATARPESGAGAVAAGDRADTTPAPGPGEPPPRPGQPPPVP
jgi:aquaporin Z